MSVKSQIIQEFEEDKKKETPQTQIDLSHPFNILQPIIFHIPFDGFCVSQLTSPGSTIINVVLLKRHIT